jgi:hypothetical protein
METTKRNTDRSDDLVTMWIDEGDAPAHGPRYSPTSVNTLAGSRVYNPDFNSNEKKS